MATNDRHARIAGSVLGSSIGRIATLVIVAIVGAAGCATQQPSPLFDPDAVLQFSVDFDGVNVPTGDGQVAAGIGGWTSDFACAYRADHARPEALRFDDSRNPDWDLVRDGGTPPPLTRSGTGVSLRVEPTGAGLFRVSLGVGGRTYIGTTPVEGAVVGFHYASYATPPEMVAIEKLQLKADDGSTLVLTGSAGFPEECSGI